MSGGVPPCRPPPTLACRRNNLRPPLERKAVLAVAEASRRGHGGRPAATAAGAGTSAWLSRSTREGKKYMQGPVVGVMHDR